MCAIDGGERPDVYSMTDADDHYRPSRPAVWLFICAVLGFISIGVALTVAIVRAMGGE